MNIQRDQADRRFDRIPEPIANLRFNNIAVAHIIDRYVHGDIITLEEMQWQLIRVLATDFEKQRKAYMDCIAMSVQPLVVPKF